MKKLLFLLLLLTSISITWAQNKHAPKKNKYIIYVDSTNDKIYYNKKLPVYFWISDKPDNTGHDVLLKPEVKKFANPYYFDTEGINTFRVKNPRGPYEEAIFEIWADDRPPLMNYHIHNLYKVPEKNKIFIGPKSQIRLDGIDGISKVKDIFYSINNQNFIYYKRPISITKAGKNIIKFYGCDLVGNCSDTISKVVYVDITPPSVHPKILNSYSDSILGKTSKITFIATDSLSGAKAIFYCSSKKGNFKLYRYPILVSRQSSGKHKIYFYAVDNVGNRTELKTLTYFIDNIPPTVSFNIKGNYFKRSDIYYLSPNTKIQLTAKDNFDVHKIFYYIYGRKYLYNGLVDLSKFSGMFPVFFNAIDVANNKSNTGSIKIFIDNEPPKTNILIGSPKFRNRDTIFISSKTKISFQAHDKYSLISKTEFAVNNLDFHKFIKPFTLDKEGLYLVNYRSIDAIGNIENTKTSIIFVDNTPPDIKIIFSVEPFDIKITKNDTIPIYPTNVKLYLGAVDKKTGEQTIYYSLNNSRFVQYRTPITFYIRKRENFFTLRVKSKDKLGNLKTEQTSFIIRKK